MERVPPNMAKNLRSGDEHAGKPDGLDLFPTELRITGYR